MPVIQIVENENGFEEIDVDLFKASGDTFTLLVPCHGDEHLDATPVALLEITRGDAHNLSTKLEWATKAAKDFADMDDHSLASVRFMNYLPEFFDGGIFYSGDDELEALGEAMDRDQCLLLTAKQVDKIKSHLPDDSYRWIRRDWSHAVIDPPIDGEIRPHSKGQVYWRAGVKHTSLTMETICLGRDLLREISSS